MSGTHPNDPFECELREASMIARKERFAIEDRFSEPLDEPIEADMTQPKEQEDTRDNDPK